jgi:DNA-binding beta-propeller fold protein YncE
MITAAGLAFVPASAQASTGSTLPITNFSQLAADSAQGYLFISQGSSDSGILVTNLAGQQKTVLDSQDEVAGLAVSADGSTLYAALPSQDEIAVIDAATLEQTTT